MPPVSNIGPSFRALVMFQLLKALTQLLDEISSVVAHPGEAARTRASRKSHSPSRLGKAAPAEDRRRVSSLVVPAVRTDVSSTPPCLLFLSQSAYRNSAAIALRLLFGCSHFEFSHYLARDSLSDKLILGHRGWILTRQGTPLSFTMLGAKPQATKQLQ